MAKKRTVKKRRVPEVLWRLFRDRARRLADTIMSLIPSSTASECRCKGRRCLACSGQDAISFLLRPDDPLHYRGLLTQCFIVVSNNAPPIEAFSPNQRWSQQELNHSSPVVKLLTCPAWDLLLERVGDSFMVYLLKHTSIFLPLPRKTHNQVAGPPISDLCPKFPKHLLVSEFQHSSLFELGPRKKRKRVGGVNSVLERQQVSNPFCCAGPCSFVSCIGCSARSYIRPFSSGKCTEKPSQMSLFETVILTSGDGNASSEMDPNGEPHQSSNQLTAKPRKRVRQFSWHRQRKRRQMSFQEINFLMPCSRIHTDKGSLSRGLQCGSNTCNSHHHEKVLPPKNL